MRGDGPIELIERVGMDEHGGGGEVGQIGIVDREIESGVKLGRRSGIAGEDVIHRVG